MKLVTKQQLQKIIHEETKNILFEGISEKLSELRWLLQDEEIDRAGFVSFLLRNPDVLQDDYMRDYIEQVFDTEEKQRFLELVEKKDFQGMKLVDVDLRGVDFTEAFLHGTVFDRSDLTDAKFGDPGLNMRAADLKGCPSLGENWRCINGTVVAYDMDATEANLKGADLSGINAWGVSLEWSNLQGANLSKSLFGDVDFMACDLRGADLRGGNFQASNFTGADMRGIKVDSHTIFNDVILDGAYLAGVDLAPLGDNMLEVRGVSLASCPATLPDYLACINRTIVGGEASLADANFEGADLQGYDFTDGFLSGTNFTGANLSEAEFFHADMRNATLDDANLTRADLRDVDLNNANMENANFAYADLTGAALPGTYCARANFTGARLFGTYLEAAILSDANFTGADLTHANFTHANLHGAIFTNAQYNERTIWPANFDQSRLQDAKLVT